MAEKISVDISRSDGGGPPEPAPRTRNTCLGPLETGCRRAGGGGWSCCEGTFGMNSSQPRPPSVASGTRLPADTSATSTMATAATPTAMLARRRGDTPIAPSPPPDMGRDPTEAHR